MSVLLIADIVNGELAIDQTAKTVTAVRELGPISILCATSEESSADQQASKFNGINNVISVKSPEFERGLAEPVANLISDLSSDYEFVVSPATASGKNILPRLAAKLDVMVITDVTKVISSDTFERPIYAGNAIQKVQSIDPKKIISIRTANFEATSLTNNAPIEIIQIKPSETSQSSWLQDKVQSSDRPELTSAKVIVSGGRGIGSKESFEIIENLANKLGAAVGASRAAVDSGFAPNDWQVGQTGKVVAPELYIAVGISGAIQHLAGMKDSKIIVAINKDEEAPIFQVADIGLVADLFSAVPELEKKL